MVRLSINGIHAPIAWTLGFKHDFGVQATVPLIADPTPHTDAEGRKDQGCGPTGWHFSNKVL